MGTSRIFAAAIAGMVTLAAATPSLADEGFYLELRGFGGWTDPGDISTTNTGTIQENNVSDPTAGGGGAVGFTFGDLPLRVEGEVMHRVRTDVDLRDTTNLIGYENNLASTTFMVGALYEYRTDSTFTPFAGGHIGIARNTSDVERSVINTGAMTSKETTVTAAAAALTLGVDVQLTSLLDLTTGYRFSYAGSFETGTLAAGDEIEGDPFLNHDLFLGLRYNF